MVLFFSGKHPKRCRVQIHDNKPNEARQSVQQWHEAFILFLKIGKIKKYTLFNIETGWFRDGYDICYYQNNLKRKNGDFFHTLTFTVKFPCISSITKMIMIQYTLLIAIPIPTPETRTSCASWS